MNPLKLACALFSATALSVSVGAQTDPIAPLDKPSELIGNAKVVIDTKAAANDNNAFTTALYERIRGQAGNIFFSPYSIWSALGMTYAGARAGTAKEMEAAMHLSLSGASLHASVAALNKALQDDATKNKYQLNIANQLWGEKTFEEFFLDGFLSLNKTYYGTSLQALNFKQDPAGSAKIINQWASDKTNARIKNIVSERHFRGSDSTAMVLTNAIYFKGNWAAQFKKANTKEAAFFLDTKETTKAKFMSQESLLRYSEDSDAQLVALPYLGGKLEMLVLLPTEKAGLSAIESTLSSPKLASLISSLRTEEVQLKLPKFKIENKRSVTEPLKSLGMTTAFDNSSADFSGIADPKKVSALLGNSKLHIFDILQNAFVEISEEGSEAAAVTAVITSVVTVSDKRPKRPKVFTANHPFLFLIRDAKTGAILFMGRCSSPV